MCCWWAAGMPILRSAAVSVLVSVWCTCAHTSVEWIPLRSAVADCLRSQCSDAEPERELLCRWFTERLFSAGTCEEVREEGSQEKKPSQPAGLVGVHVSLTPCDTLEGESLCWVTPEEFCNLWSARHWLWTIPKGRTSHCGHLQMGWLPSTKSFFGKGVSLHQSTDTETGRLVSWPIKWSVWVTSSSPYPRSGAVRGSFSGHCQYTHPLASYASSVPNTQQC